MNLETALKENMAVFRELAGEEHPAPEPMRAPAAPVRTPLPEPDADYQAPEALSAERGDFSPALRQESISTLRVESAGGAAHPADSPQEPAPMIYPEPAPREQAPGPDPAEEMLRRLDREDRLLPQLMTL